MYFDLIFFFFFFFFLFRPLQGQFQSHLLVTRSDLLHLPGNPVQLRLPRLFLVAPETPIPVAASDLLHADQVFVGQRLDVFLDLDAVDRCHGREYLLQVFERVTGPGGAEVGDDQVLFGAFREFGGLLALVLSLCGGGRRQTDHGDS